MTNRERLENAKILRKDDKLSPEQEKAIESLSKQEIETLLSVKDKLLDKFPPDNLLAPITHHH